MLTDVSLIVPNIRTVYLMLRQGIEYTLLKSKSDLIHFFLRLFHCMHESLSTLNIFLLGIPTHHVLRAQDALLHLSKASFSCHTLR